jgi:hypothetical protein
VPAGRRKDEAHAPARHPAEHPEAPEITAERGARARDEAFGVEIAHPWDDRLQRPEEIGGQRAAESADFAGGKLAENFIQRGHGLMARGPLGLAAQEVFLRHHLENRPYVLRHSAVHQHERLLQPGAGRRRHPVGPKQRMAGQQPAAAETVLDIAGLRGDALNKLDARPETTRVLPAATGAAEPFAENRARRNHPPFGFFHRTAQRPDLSGCAHAGADQRAEQVGGDGQPRTLGNSIHVADQLESPAGSERDTEQLRQPCA